MEINAAISTLSSLATWNGASAIRSHVSPCQDPGWADPQGLRAYLPALCGYGPELAQGLLGFYEVQYSQEHQPPSDPVRELVGPLQSLDQKREQDSRDIVCGICMDKVWDKPEAERMFGILPNCSHAHCLGCLRTWRKSQHNFPLDVIKACPQCRVHSSYIIPHKFWVSKGAEKEQLIRNFKARTSQIRCRFFMQGNGHCPFKSDCIYLHQLPDEALTSDPPWTESAGPSRVPGGHRAGRRSVIHGLCLGHGFLGFRTLTGFR
ncbi:probable E3 ubiquitin-protein ligase makorin-1 [Lutra lutra]|uniref:probable E3 ubiquitin-protein ligase makorin-1 n=1 Tax=Lutra lutra TaxID=9657 RepID=UPI001FD216CC|nr:probable E3 ubiquitin-protein ligase makorin-1 [Lutra lutra]